MARLIYIEASPRKERSASIAVTKTFLEEYQKLNPNDTLHTIDLWERKLPEFDGNTINAKYAILHKQQPSEAEKMAWKPVESLIEEFKSGDKFVVSTPMWNYSIPYRLKQYIDILVQPTYTFIVDKEQGYVGLISGRPLLLLCARGGAYPDHNIEEGDYQTTYLEKIFSFIGFKKIDSIFIEPTLGDKEKALATARAQAIDLARSF